MKKILVTGGLGFIGSNLINLLLKKKYYVINIDKSSYSANPYNVKEFKKNKLIKHVILLHELDASQYAKDILKHLAELNIEKGSEVLAADLATSLERYDFAIQISKKASYEKRFYNKYNYPIIATPKVINNKNMPKSEVILAIIRQESEFDKSANSWAGARGMMQLMKYTAKIVAKEAKLPYSISGLTRDPEYNIKLGSYYFNSLIEDYNGIYPFAIAAYNAGPNRVKTCRRVNGDPSKGELSYINWIEQIRFEETRNYVQRVLENYNVYRYILSQKPIFLVVNKVDNTNKNESALEFYELGFSEIFSISSVSGSGTGELLDSLINKLPGSEIVGVPASDISEIIFLFTKRLITVSYTHLTLPTILLV